MSSLHRLIDLDAPARLRARDASLFSADPAVQAEVTANLGWTMLASGSAAAVARVREVADQLLTESLDDVVLLGMGGSSLASLVIDRVLGGTAYGAPRLWVVDTTSPVTVDRLLGRLDLHRTAFLLSSKSGTTIEPLSLYAIFREAADATLGREAAGRRFIATTDPGTALESFAAENGFRAVVSSPADVGGRYSALSVFGLLPAALLGIDLDELVRRASLMEATCALPPAENPAAQLAAFAVDAQVAGRDKLTVIASPGLDSFGLWVEQLVAESLGKEGTGIVPVVDLADDKPLGLSGDRALVVVRFANDSRLGEWTAQWSEHLPVTELVVDDPLDLGAEFVRWEHAVALMGPLLGVNPFGQPNVAAAKDATAAVLAGRTQPPSPQGAPSEEGASFTFAGTLPAPGHIEASIGTAVGHAVATLQKGDYLAVLAYLPDDLELLGPLVALVPRVSEALGVAVTLELGPRYLHSTGQFHKGGPNSGVFVLVTTGDGTDLAVPGKPWGLRALHRAQAEGDLVTLASAGRRVVRIDLPDATQESVDALVRGLADASGMVTEER